MIEVPPERLLETLEASQRVTLKLTSQLWKIKDDLQPGQLDQWATHIIEGALQTLAVHRGPTLAVAMAKRIADQWTPEATDQAGPGAA